jgi:glucose-6-phosphate 1-dehydrogenase
VKFISLEGTAFVSTFGSFWRESSMTKIRRLVVIHGASGDLFFRKLLPAFYSLYCKYGDRVSLDLLGTGNKFSSSEEFREKILEALNGMELEYRHAIPSFVTCFDWVKGRCSEAMGAKKIADAIDAYRIWHPNAKELHYFSLWPEAYVPTLGHYLNLGLVTPEKVKDWPASKVQIVLEKPLAESVDQTDSLRNMMKELVGDKKVNEVFVAYDHYLFKNGVWGILVWRFANHISEPTHNWQKIKSINIRAHERVTVGARNGYVGAVMDMIANHLFAVYGLLRVGHPLKKGEKHFMDGEWLESPNDECLDANWLHPRMESISRELLNPGVFVGLDLARYTRGELDVLTNDGRLVKEEVPGFLEAGGNPLIETGARLVLRPGVSLDTNPCDRWGKAVPFSLESAKGTRDKETSYGISHRGVPSQFFTGSPFDPDMLIDNARSIIIEREKFQEITPDCFKRMRVWGDSRLTMVPGSSFPQMEPRRVDSLVELPEVGDGYPQAMTELLIPHALQRGHDREEGQMVRSLCLLPAEVQLNVIRAVVPKLVEARNDPDTNWIEYPVGTLPKWPEI